MLLRLTRLGLAVLLSVLVFGGTAAAQTDKSGKKTSGPKRVNILFILADDLGYGDLACYGHTKIKTPNLDRLAKQGMRFTQFYVTAPVCTPSRASFLTGRHAQRFGIFHADLPERDPRYPLPDDTVNVARLLRQAGYRTAHFGKWHLGEPPLVGMPRSFGFDHFFGSMGGRPSSSWNKYARYDDAQFILNENQPKTYPGYATNVLTDHVLSYLDKVGKEKQPFYVNVWYNSPHEPLSPKVKEADQYKGFSKQEQVYYGSVTNLDYNIGRLLQKLEELGIAENTMVIFSSDNGPEHAPKAYSAGSAGRLRGKKTQLWEGGVRVPFLVRLTGTVPPNKTSDAVASALDFLPTLCELTGVVIPNRKQLDEGINLLPVLTGKEAGPKRTLYWEFRHAQRGGPPSGTLAIREGDWKLHVYQKEGKKALYDLAKDVGETTDVSAQHPALAARLEQQALAWFRTLPTEKGPAKKNPIPKSEAEANRLPLK